MRGILLFDPKTSSQQTKRDIFVTVAHEMSHQWFGNLVATTAWWNNLWLNEGFASSWMEVKATDHFNPDWQNGWLQSAALDKAAVSERRCAQKYPPIPFNSKLATKARPTTHSTASPTRKAGRFLRMLEDYLGEEEFRKGVHRYLSAHQYSNATTADLVGSLGKSFRQTPFTKISAGWTEQPGLPVVNVKTDCVNRTAGCLVGTGAVHRAGPAHARPLLWKIPVALMDVPQGRRRRAMFCFKTSRKLRQTSVIAMASSRRTRETRAITGFPMRRSAVLQVAGANHPTARRRPGSICSMMSGPWWKQNRHLGHKIIFTG